MHKTRNRSDLSKRNSAFKKENYNKSSSQEDELKIVKDLLCLVLQEDSIRAEKLLY